MTTAPTSDPAFIAALGTASDRMIGERFGIKLATVAYQRNARGIPSYRKSAMGDRIEALLGKGLSDSAIATTVGVDRAAVRRRREKRGIVNAAGALARQRVEAVLTHKATHPSASIRAIAQATGVGKSRVGKILKDYPMATFKPEPVGPRRVVEVWGLFAYDNPAEVSDHAAYDAATYRMDRADLPFGGWVGQGYTVEVARKVMVPEGSPVHQSATR